MNQCWFKHSPSRRPLSDLIGLSRTAEVELYAVEVSPQIKLVEMNLGRCRSGSTVHYRRSTWSEAWAVTEIVRKLGISEQSFYRGKKTFAGLGISDLFEAVDPEYGHDRICARAK